MPDLTARLAQKNLTIPEPSVPLASYVPAVAIHSGAIVLIAGQVPVIDGKPIAVGHVGQTISIEVAQECARRCVLNGLAALRAEIGDLARLRRVARVGCFVACSAQFTEHPKVANGASDLLVELLGDDGKHARAAVGVASLPLGVPVEIEFTFVVD
jgi:enamine deaminase RidA (YjgF/YER057c/UK114 family)